MATVIRPEISMKNKYWISKHRHYELKHFCLQYPLWKNTYAALSNPNLFLATCDGMPTGNLPGDPTGDIAVRKVRCLEKIDLVEKAAKDADEYLWTYILKAVTEELSYTYLRTKMNIPCGRDTYYDRYRKFFWLLSEARN